VALAAPAEHQVLQRRLGALRPAEGEQHQHVHRQRQQLDAEEEREEAVAPSMQAAP
jgi:hypothetical protein